MIRTKTGGWIINVETRMKIPLRRVGKTCFMDACVKLPDKSKRKDKDNMDIDNINSKKSSFCRPSDP